jgi:hypothetical protein
MRRIEARPRRVIGKAEIMTDSDNPRFLVTNLPACDFKGDTGPALRRTLLHTHHRLWLAVLAHLLVERMQERPWRRWCVSERARIA